MSAFCLRFLLDEMETEQQFVQDGVRPDGTTKPWDGKAPTSIAAAVLYLLCNHPKVLGFDVCNIGITTVYKQCSKCPTAMQDLSLISGMANMTIANVYKDLLREAVRVWHHMMTAHT